MRARSRADLLRRDFGNVLSLMPPVHTVDQLLCRPDRCDRASSQEATVKAKPGHECQAVGWQGPVTNRYAAIFAFASQGHWPRSEHRT
jgi:hypothetical protein